MGEEEEFGAGEFEVGWSSTFLLRELGFGADAQDIHFRFWKRFWS